jgi:Flp pilus assembly protein TadD
MANAERAVVEANSSLSRDANADLRRAEDIAEKPETEPVDDVRRAIVSEAWMRVTMMDSDIIGEI